MESVLFEKKGPIAYIILNRPKMRNSLSLELMEILKKKIIKVSKDKDLKVIIIKGNGPSFCAGHDLYELVGEKYSIHHFREIFTKCSEIMKLLHKIPQVVIAQVHGIATAAGCQLVAACDLATCEENARFATPGVKIGLFCSTPMVPLSRIIGRRRALDMLFTGRFVSSEEAQSFGLINRVYKKGDLEGKTRKWAEEISKTSRLTLSIGKEAFYTQVNQNEEKAYDYSKEIISLNCLTEDAQEGMSAFIEKRKAKWKEK